MWIMSANTQTERPVVCLVHGAGHQPLHLRYLLHALERLDVFVITPLNPTSGYDDHSATKTHLDDVANVHRLVLPYLEQGRKAVIAGFSYGGKIVTQAAAGLSVAERSAAGKIGGVVGLLYIAAFTDKSQPLTPEILAYGPETRDPVRKTIKAEVAIEAMYHDCDPERAREAVALLQRQSPRNLEGEAICEVSDVGIPKHYIVCRNDRFIPYETQLRFTKDAAAVVLAELDCGHSPFLRDDGIEVIVDCIAKCLDV